ncbi:MAG: hypothetical protein ACI9F9_001567 [Candidatus Paceibacteria bacterium]|jgi:uncharacterized protein YheU (UPF0270 family)
MEEQSGILIPAEALAPGTLRNLIEEFVTRDGTEFTDSSIKIQEVEAALKLGEVQIWFDSSSKTCCLQRI